MSKAKKSYSERVNVVLHLVELGRKLGLDSRDISIEHRKNHGEMMDLIEKFAKYPEKGFATIRSFVYIENMLLGYYNKAQGDHIEKFWEEISRQGIDFQRRDILKEVLKRKRIININEYDEVRDDIVVAQQIGKITSEEAELLGSYLVNFEKRQSKRSSGL